MGLMSQSPLSALLMVVLIFSMPFATPAHQDSVEVKAKQDAEADINRPFWFFAGCTSSIAGVFAGTGISVLLSGYQSSSADVIFMLGVPILVTMFSSVLSTKVPAYPSPEQLIGKSPEYVEIYTNAYKTKTQQLRNSSLLIGGGLVIGTLGVAFIFDN